MLEIARKTGGRAFVNGNDIAGAIRASIQDSRVTYTLGFYPDSHTPDGKFHSLSIRVPSRRGITLRYRSGYVNDAFSSSDLARRARDLDQAFWSPLDANAIPLTTKAHRDGAGRANIDLSINVASLNLIPEDGKRKGEVDILILQRNETGNMFGRVNETIQMSFSQDTYTKLMPSGARITAPSSWTPGNHYSSSSERSRHGEFGLVDYSGHIPQLNRRDAR
jgi:hypothetical protein